jgi:SRSO17 transposase
VLGQALDGGGVGASPSLPLARKERHLLAEDVAWLGTGHGILRALLPALMESMTVPKASPDPLPEIVDFLAPFAPLFRRPQSRASLERYVTGLLTDLPRKNCEAIAAAVAGTSTERLQHLLTDADWDAAALDEARVRQLAAASPAGGVLVVDDTGLAKQGKASAGVARQYSGTLGKVGNCQVVVSAEYAADAPAATRPLHWPVAARLYLPEPWADDADRCKRAGVPAGVAFATKPAIALDLVDRAVEWGVPFAVVVADANYGSTPAFLDGLEARGCAYVVAVDADFGLRWPEEVRAAAAPPPPYGGRGRPRKTPLPPRHTAAELAAAIPDAAWRTVTWRTGTAGPLRRRVAALRLHRGTGGRAGNTRARVTTGPEGWFLVERPAVGEEGDPKYYLSNLPPDTPLERLVALAHSRWVVEQFYEDAKGECGLADHQGRRWDSLHRHLALAMLAYTFLVLQRSGADPARVGLSPLRQRPLPSSRPPPDPHLAPAGPCPLVRPVRTDQPLPAAPELTK